MSTKKEFFPAIWNAETCRFEAKTPYPYAKSFRAYGETWVIHRTPYERGTPKNNWRVSHKDFGGAVFTINAATQDEAMQHFHFFCTPRKPLNKSPEQYVREALERTKAILYQTDPQP